MHVPDLSALLRGALGRVESVQRDAGTVFQALGIWGVIFFLAHVVLGAMPLSVAILLGELIDAMIGARGIGTMTSEVTGSMWRFLALMMLTFVAYLFVARFRDRAAGIGGMLRDVVMTLCLLAFLITQQQSGLAFFLMVTLLVDVFFLETFQLRLGVLGLAILVNILIAEKIVRFTVLKSFTIGEGIAILVVMAMMLTLLKIRFARPSYALHH